MTANADHLARRLSLIVVTDADLAGPRGVPHVVRAALRGGAPAVQLRVKQGTARDMVALCRLLLPDVRNAGALLFINDRVDVALAAQADGAHLGDDDLPLAAARRIVPPGFLLGRSADSPDEALRAQAQGADYVGIGPVFPTRSKADAGTTVGLAAIRAVAAAVSIPVVGIGGIDETTAADVRAAGAAGVAVIRAVMRAPDPAETVRMLLPS